MEKLRIMSMEAHSNQATADRPWTYIGAIGPPTEANFGSSLAKETLLTSEEAIIAAASAKAVTLAKAVVGRISDNNFIGKIPDFIRNWTKIEKLHIQGCPLEGPIPSSISALTSVTDLLGLLLVEREVRSMDLTMSGDHSCSLLPLNTIQ
ncbi:probable LRR receptor-like serine/threonine-protein kinase At1g07650 isoform X2 [Diospyros lotus]|uniref:probable LRR receptor-like serine/threonine-protein kinase At1g07650 isoform X2 n=1 Tax=Diospyros lotus TaxID=55363 RepID=UPI00225880DA|nr:probable LRR receptor-like serine/threonine-protein kinase At1g07650 isoform X2 [Diospyros lotus]